MRDRDKEQILIFILRTPMYLGEVNKDRIFAFVTGYEIGAENNCQFTVELIKYLKEKYQIPYRALGWPYQVQQLANKRRISWVSAFKGVSLELLNQSPSQEFGLKLKKDTRGIVQNKVRAPEYWFKREWIEDWVGICNLSQSWFKQLWNEEEWTLISQLNTVVLNIERESKTLAPTSRLLLLAKKLNEILNKNAT